MKEGLSTVDFRNAIEIQASILIGSIRNYSRGQADLWQQVPVLALEADGHRGYSDNYARAYRSKLWPITKKYGYYDGYVDLTTGDLVEIYTMPKKELGALKGKKVLELANNLEVLDAKQLIKSLTKAGQQPYFEGYDAERVEAWREQLRRELKL